jgi:hypothetical protein
LPILPGLPNPHILTSSNFIRLIRIVAKIPACLHKDHHSSPRQLFHLF